MRKDVIVVMLHRAGRQVTGVVSARTKIGGCLHPGAYQGWARLWV